MEEGDIPMTELDPRLTSDTLFKMLFTKYPELLKGLVTALLGISVESIGSFAIRNPEMPPEYLGDKFCRLDIAMTVDGQRVNLEVQVRNEGDYPARALYHWAREYSTALPAGAPYEKLPRTVVISIVDFELFDGPEFHADFRALEVTRHTPLSDNFNIIFFELPKVPEPAGVEMGLELWLALFKAKTEEDLARIKVRTISPTSTHPDFRRRTSRS
jgi:predicted transposase/invertase (TIGR01784 family)